MSKPNCYDCKHRRPLLGSTHSGCYHPSIKAVIDEPLMQIAAILGGAGIQGGPLNIVGSPHGIKNGWFAWPANYDPIWLENCDGFEAKSKTQEVL